MQESALDERIVLAWNGRGVESNGHAMVEYLRARRVRELWVVQHPLLRGDSFLEPHSVDVYRRGEHVENREVKLPFYPPATYPLDLLVPRMEGLPVDRWIGFTNLCVARGLWHRRRFGVKKLVYLCVDFSEDRFGASLATKAYDYADRLACLSADEIWPISQVSHDARMQRLRIEPRGRVHVLPMGAWLERTPCVSEDNYARKRLVFIGGLLEKQGVQGTIDALVHLDQAYELDVYGKGPYEAELKAYAARRGLSSRVHFRGFVASHHELERILAESTLAVACYIPGIASFSKYADPAKLKAYLAAGLPIVLTDVSPNAREIADRAGGELTEYEPTKIAAAIERSMVSREGWWRRSRAARAYMGDFDWNILFGDAFQLGAAA